MSTIQLLRLASRNSPNQILRAPTITRCLPFLSASPSGLLTSGNFSTSARRTAGQDGHDHEESFEEFTARFEKEFEGVQDVFELQRNLNNAFAYDLVPSPTVIAAALRAARRVNDYPTAVRVFEGIKAKVENKGQYDEYVRDLASLRDELGVNLKEELYPDNGPIKA